MAKQKRERVVNGNIELFNDDLREREREGISEEESSHEQENSLLSTAIIRMKLKY